MALEDRLVGAAADLSRRLKRPKDFGLWTRVALGKAINEGWIVSMSDAVFASCRECRERSFRSTSLLLNELDSLFRFVSRLVGRLRLSNLLSQIEFVLDHREYAEVGAGLDLWRVFIHHGLEPVSGALPRAGVGVRLSGSSENGFLCSGVLENLVHDSGASASLRDR